ncbi:MAG: GNAT family N-acetyltransferase, partial [Phycisphaerales bacterium]|nr:GNAT family N-acetyltransferase [Phycisphaerales bacterium]
MTDLRIHPLGPGDERACERILRALPDWFGIESALRDYVEDCGRLPTWIARNERDAVGFVTVRTHFPRAAEIHCMAIDPAWHRRGVGRRLVEFAANRLRDEGV